MSANSLPKIFINYRIVDTAYQADALYRFLLDYLPENHIFIDTEAIEPSRNFVHEIQERLKVVDIVLVLVGHHWEQQIITYHENKWQDWVVEEIHSAMTATKQMLPVFFDRKEMRVAELSFQMPSVTRSFRDLSEIHGVFVARKSLETDFLHLAKKLKLELLPDALRRRNKLADLEKQLEDTQAKLILANDSVASLRSERQQLQTKIVALQTEIAQLKNPLKPKFSSYTETVNGVSFTMLALKGDTYTMGSPKDEPGRMDYEIQHQVSLSDFYMGETQVTQELWQAVMGNNPSGFKNAGLQAPVENVSWEDGQEFIKKLNQLTGKSYRLPTEAEWEYTARAGTTTPFNTGNNLTTDQANYNGNYPYNNNPKGEYRRTTTSVKSFAANAWGLYDMNGNVWEWCNDWYGAYPTTPQTDPKGPETGSRRVLRGGGWDSFAGYCRSANRYDYGPSIGDYSNGFRLAL